MEAKLKHLEFIQGAIGRMANNSFLFKGWAITVTAGLLAIAAFDQRGRLVAVAFVTSLLFWGLDGYYLWLERGFVKLHKQVAIRSEDEIDFSMDVDKTDAGRQWLRTCVRPHLVAFYGLTILVDAVAIFVIGRN